MDFKVQSRTDVTVVWFGCSEKKGRGTKGRGTLLPFALSLYYFAFLRQEVPVFRNVNTLNKKRAILI